MRFAADSGEQPSRHAPISLVARCVAALRIAWAHIAQPRPRARSSCAGGPRETRKKGRGAPSGAEAPMAR